MSFDPHLEYFYSVLGNEQHVRCLVDTKNLFEIIQFAY